MADSTSQRPKYNVTLSRLIRKVIELPQEAQEKLLRLIEDNETGIVTPLEREHQRKNCLIAVDYAFNGRAYRSFIQDISSGGIFIETRERLAVGQEIIFSFSVSRTGNPIKCRGEVAWACPDGMGIRFLNLPKLQENILKATINALPQDKSDA